MLFRSGVVVAEDAGVFFVSRRIAGNFAQVEAVGGVDLNSVVILKSIKNYLDTILSILCVMVIFYR